MTLPVLINGEWLQGKGKAFQSLNPATGDVFWQGCAADEQQIAKAVAAARAATTSWVFAGLEQRVYVARRFAEILGEQKEAFAVCVATETGKPLWEARTEVAAMIGKVEISVQAYTERTGQRSSEVAGAQAVLRHKPTVWWRCSGPITSPATCQMAILFPR